MHLWCICLVWDLHAPDVTADRFILTDGRDLHLHLHSNSSCHITCNTSVFPVGAPESRSPLRRSSSRDAVCPSELQDQSADRLIGYRCFTGGTEDHLLLIGPSSGRHTAYALELTCFCLHGNRLPHALFDFPNKLLLLGEELLLGCFELLLRLNAPGGSPFYRNTNPSMRRRTRVTREDHVTSGEGRKEVWSH